MSEHVPEVERRAYPRFPSTKTVWIELNRPGEKEDSQTIKQEAEVRDISRGGVRLQTDLELEEAQILKLHLPIPGTTHLPPQPVEVCWILTAPPGESTQVGLRFLI
jgi:PilZ domain